MADAPAKPIDPNAPAPIPPQINPNLPKVFCHLHTHSHYSLLTALPKTYELAKTAKKMGMPAIALTDNGNLYGAIEFYKDCKKEELKAIIGIDAYVALRTRHDKESIDKRKTRLILLAKTFEGYRNLIKIVTLSNMEGFYYKPRVDRELLEKYHAGLIAIAPAITSDISAALHVSDQEKALEKIDFYKKTFGSDFYLEITHHPELDNHSVHMEDIKALSKKTGVPLVASHEVYYLKPEDKPARDTLLSVQGSIDATDRSDEDENYSFISPEQAAEYFKDIPEALENNYKIVSECNYEIPLGKWMFPHIDAAPGKTHDETLRDIVYAGFERRRVEKTEAVIKRVDYELEVIKVKGYAPYFLLVADLLRHARANGILSNIRGSVSGSMVTYLSGITNIDPLEYQIPFERFLNPERPSAPDIDMDYADNRRDEMVEYTRNKYGQDKVAQIGTFGTMAARGSVKDAARALGFPHSLGDLISKAVPMGSQGFPMTLERALEEAPDLKKMYDDNADVKKIVDMAMKIEGSARHIGVHAAGVVVAPVPLTDVVPLQYDPKGEGKIITQFDMYSIDEENAGLLKFDFLGLKNLSIIADTFKLAERLQGVKLDMDMIPIDDKKTFEMLARGETVDLFQLNGTGMTKFLVDLKPTTIHDINAMVALYRPGPIQFIPQYIERKHDPSKVSYLDPALEEILQKTYGILVYQDDLLMMAHKLAGYSWGKVDKFRKAVGKKIPELMAAEREGFISGCVKTSGWTEKKATEVWAWLEPFAAYGFNKAHSVSYGKIAYITAYLKANYPGEYMRAVLTSEQGEVEKVAESIAECKRMGIEVLPPDLNESYREFTLIKGENGKNIIRFGLTTIKNFGDGIGQAITEERKKAGKFTSLENFLDRVKDRNLNKKSLEALIKSGALDNFGERGTLLGNLDDLLAYNKEKGNSPQISLFAGLESTSGLRLKPMPAVAILDRLAWEKELLGLYISGHPLEAYAEKMKSFKRINEIKTTMKANTTTIVCGTLETIRVIPTKKGDEMAFLKIADTTGTIEVVAFPKAYAQYKSLFLPDTCIAIKGKLSEKDGNLSLLAEMVKKIS